MSYYTTSEWLQFRQIFDTFYGFPELWDIQVTNDELLQICNHTNYTTATVFQIGEIDGNPWTFTAPNHGLDDRVVTITYDVQGNTTTGQVRFV